MAMPAAGPKIGCPRYCRFPALGSDRPAIKRNKVDLPDPERPRRPTICPSRSSRFIPSKTNSSAPSGLGKALRTSEHCNRGEVFMSTLKLGQSIFALGVIVQGAPEKTVDDHHEQTHGSDPEN